MLKRACAERLAENKWHNSSGTTRGVSDGAQYQAGAQIQHELGPHTQGKVRHCNQADPELGDGSVSRQ